MCGIAGIVNLDLKETNQVEQTILMAEALIHRGPDDSGFYFGGRNTNKKFRGDIKPSESIQSFIALGHRRLSILDLSAQGNQPMSYLNKYWITYNGEVYNYVELRAELIDLGYSFESDTDTEVIIASYDCWGTNCLKRFNGMWAFALYNIQTRVLFISRDQFGIKPFLYYLDEQHFVFASEAKALLRTSHVLTAPNLKNINEFIKGGPKLYNKETSFENIYSFPSGCYVELELSRLKFNTFFPTPFWDKSVKTANRIGRKSEDEYISEYNRLIENSVRLRLRADVAIGTALSGGLDSSTVAYYVNKILKETKCESRQKTFSLVFKNIKDKDESFFIERIAKELDLNSYQIEPNISDVLKIYEKVVYTMDFPQVDSLMSCTFTYQLVQDSCVKISIDGQGADELQAGYLDYLRNHFSNLPLNQFLREYKVFRLIPGAHKEVLIGMLFGFIRMFGLKKITMKLLSSRINDFNNPFLTVNEALNADFYGNLQNLLHYGDRSSMMNSIEARFPFLDKNLVEFWEEMPSEYKLRSGITKYLARKSLDGKLPMEIVWRKDKMGWETPEYIWITNDMNLLILQEIQNSEFLNRFRKDKIKAIKILKSKNVRMKDVEHVTKMYNLAIWHRIFFSSDK